MLKRKNYIGEKIPWIYRLKGVCYYSRRCPVEYDHIVRKRSLVMRLYFGKKNDRYA